MFQTFPFRVLKFTETGLCFIKINKFQRPQNDIKQAFHLYKCKMVTARNLYSIRVPNSDIRRD